MQQVIRNKTMNIEFNDFDFKINVSNKKLQIITKLKKNL